MALHLGTSQPMRARLRHVAGQVPFVLGVYAATALALGFGFGNAAVDAVGVAATAGGFAAGDIGIRRATRYVDSLG